MEPTSVFEAVGGEPFFVALVDRFYDGVSGDPILRPMYPDDLTEAKLHLAQFLMQYWGGPTTYSDARGHPRLRMRHAPFVVDQAARDAWFSHMSAALDAAEVSGDIELQMRSYFSMAADGMINQEPA